MRKFLFLLPVFLFLFGTRSLAYSDAEINNFKEITSDFWPGTYTSDSYPNLILTKWEELGYNDYDCIFTKRVNSEGYGTFLCEKGTYTLSENKFVSNGCWYFVVSQRSYVANLFQGSGVAYYMSQLTESDSFNIKSGLAISGDDVQGSYELFYNPFIVTPNISTVIDSNVGYPVESPVVPLAVSFTNVPEGYFVQVQTKYYVATDIEIGYDKFASKLTYTALWREHTDLYDLKAIGDGYTGGAGNNLLPSDFFDDWSLLVAGFTEKDFDFESASGLNTAMFNRGKTTYLNTYLNALNGGGNVVEIYARYYYLEDNKAYVGDWLHWFSFAPTEFYVVQPYQGEVVQGVSGTQSNEEKDLSQDNGSSLDNNITIQGGSTTNNTNVVVNVPNAYNYPTIQSFNHDNIIASFASAQSNMSGLLDGFAQFAAATLTWIPGQVWAIVTMGFAAALVIMIIKIL